MDNIQSNQAEGKEVRGEDRQERLTRTLKQNSPNSPLALELNDIALLEGAHVAVRDCRGAELGLGGDLEGKGVSIAYRTSPLIPAVTPEAQARTSVHSPRAQKGAQLIV